MRNSTISEDDQHPAYKVKLSGDGAKRTRVTNFIVISFSILNDKDARMSSSGKYSFKPLSNLKFRGWPFLPVMPLPRLALKIADLTKPASPCACMPMGAVIISRKYYNYNVFQITIKLINRF